MRMPNKEEIKKWGAAAVISIVGATLGGWAINSTYTRISQDNYRAQHEFIKYDENGLPAFASQALRMGAYQTLRLSWDESGALVQARLDKYDDNVRIETFGDINRPIKTCIDNTGGRDGRSDGRVDVMIIMDENDKEHRLFRSKEDRRAEYAFARCDNQLQDFKYSVIAAYLLRKGAK